MKSYGQVVTLSTRIKAPSQRYVGYYKEGLIVDCNVYFFLHE